MLRVGLTGGLGSGKSTAASMLASHGAFVLEADEIGRQMMRSGQAVFAAIVDRFGPGVVKPDGELDRAKLAHLAFTEGRVEDLNAIVHPAVIARQVELTAEITSKFPTAVVLVESALIFETRFGERNLGTPEPAAIVPGSGELWHSRFDRLILVAAPKALKVARFVDRSLRGRPATGDAELAELEAEAHRRLARQIDDESKAKLCDYTLVNDGSLAELQKQVASLWPRLAREAGQRL